MRRELELALRRARLGVLLVWRRVSPPMAEITADTEGLAERERLVALEERRIAAEEYHWAIAGERRGE
jgi:hypothetical protein